MVNPLLFGALWPVVLPELKKRYNLIKQEIFKTSYFLPCNLSIYCQKALEEARKFLCEFTQNPNAQVNIRSLSNLINVDFPLGFMHKELFPNNIPFSHFDDQKNILTLSLEMLTKEYHICQNKHIKIKNSI